LSVLFSRMRLPACLPLFLTLLAGCTQPAHLPQSYRATITRVSPSPWQHYTMVKGYGVQHEIVLQVQPGDQPFTLLLFDIYSPEVFGDDRDAIAFLYSGRLPRDGKLWLDQLKGYRIERRVP
jgi:hypothetical protein